MDESGGDSAEDDRAGVGVDGDGREGEGCTGGEGWAAASKSGAGVEGGPEEVEGGMGCRRRGRRDEVSQKGPG